VLHTLTTISLVGPYLTINIILGRRMQSATTFDRIFLLVWS